MTRWGLKLVFYFQKFFSKRTCSLIWCLFDECEGFRWNLVNERGYHRMITRWKHNIRVHPHVPTIEVWRLKIAIFCDSDNTYSTVSVFDSMYDAKNGCEALRWVNIVIFHSVLTYMCSTHKYQLRKIPTPEPPRRVATKGGPSPSPPPLKLWIHQYLHIQHLLWVAPRSGLSVNFKSKISKRLEYGNRVE